MDTTDARYGDGGEEAVSEGGEDDGGEEGEEAVSEGGGDGAELHQLRESEVGSKEQAREVSLERRLRKRGRGA